MSTFILIDVSASMATPVPKMAMRPRIDLLHDMLENVLREFPAARLIAFSSLPRELEGFWQEGGLALPEPDGGTALHLALEYVGARQPISRLIVITDGQVDDPERALELARLLAPLTIDAFMVGEETDRVATSFVRKLSLAGGTGRGRWGVRDLSKPLQIAAEIRGLLTGPKR